MGGPAGEGPVQPCRPEAPLVNLSHYFLGLFTRFISLLFNFIIRKITFNIRKMGFYHTKWNGVLQRTLVLRHFLAGFPSRHLQSNANSYVSRLIEDGNYQIMDAISTLIINYQY